MFFLYNSPFSSILPHSSSYTGLPKPERCFLSSGKIPGSVWVPILCFVDRKSSLSSKLRKLQGSPCLLLYASCYPGLNAIVPYVLFKFLVV